MQTIDRRGDVPAAALSTAAASSGAGPDAAAMAADPPAGLLGGDEPPARAESVVARRKLPTFIAAFEDLLDGGRSEADVVAEGRRLLAELVAVDDWLPPAFAVAGADRFQQYPLHVDPAGRFSVVSFVWGPGQATPIHDHTVWGLIGMLRGAEYSQGYRFDGPARLVPDGLPLRLEPGRVEAVSPTLGDVHRVNNAFDDRVSISIHVYGADIGAVRRSVYAEDGSRRDFVSGYSAVPSGA